MGSSNVLRAVGVVALAIALIECGYRLVYWYWMSISVRGQRAVAEAHFHSWLTAAAILALAWIYLSWKLLAEDRSASKKKKAAGTRKTQV